jgi:hypothetical protein
LILDVPYLEDSYIEDEANKILEKYHPSRTIPIPIESIVELGLRIDIAPFPNLYLQHRLRACMTRDRKTIFVDKKQYYEFEEICRFSIAHELGHHILHWKYLENLPYKDVVGYTDWKTSLPGKVSDRFESQGNRFAGFILMPTAELIEVCKKIVDGYRQELKGLRMDPWEYIANDVAAAFEVSPKAAEIQIRFVGIPSLIRLS